MTFNHSLLQYYLYQNLGKYHLHFLSDILLNPALLVLPLTLQSAHPDSIQRIHLSIHLHSPAEDVLLSIFRQAS